MGFDSRLVTIGLEIFVTVLLLLESGEDAQEAQVTPSLHFNGSSGVNYSNMLQTNEELNMSIGNISFKAKDVIVFPPPIMHFLGYTLPQGHPCNSFTLPPPPADRKRTGPRRKIFSLDFLVSFQFSFLF